MAKSTTFPVRSNLLPKTDPRYKKWRDSLKKRPPPWNVGKTKETHPSARKISVTFKIRKIDNFAKWREKARKDGLIPASYPPFEKDKNLAFLTGLILGDGHIAKFPRTERLTIALGTVKPGLVDFASVVVEKIFNKKPHIYIPIKENVAKVSIYQKKISKRLKIPSGNRRYSKVGIPLWIWRSEKYLIACLRGLYEAEGSLSIHLPTYTYNFSFSNTNKKLLKDVERALKRIGLHPEIRSNAIRLRRKNEVKYFKNLINFRAYNAGWSNGSLVALWKRRSRFES